MLKVPILNNRTEVSGLTKTLAPAVHRNCHWIGMQVVPDSAIISGGAVDKILVSSLMVLGCRLAESLEMKRP